MNGLNRPLSVIDGRDPLVLSTMLAFYAKPGAVVVDVTANNRRMWEGVTWSGPVTWCDIDPDAAPDIVADFRALPFPDASVDVLVFDPPHVPDAGHMGDWWKNYGLESAPKLDNVSSYFRPFLLEARRVLRPDGVVFAKLKDYVHNHRYQWMLVEWVLAVRETEGLTACDLIVKRDPCGGNLKSGRWVRAHHVRNAHCWWAVVRKGRCEPRRALRDGWEVTK